MDDPLVPLIDWNALSPELDEQWLLQRAITDDNSQSRNAFPDINDVLNATDVDLFCSELIRTEQFRPAALAGCSRWSIYFDQFLEGTADPVSFRGHMWIRTMHNVPRLGNPRDISVLVNGSPEESDEYLKGLKAMAICSWTLFALWALVLIYCKYAKRGGILSARPPLSPQEKRKAEWDKLPPRRNQENDHQSQSAKLRQDASNFTTQTEETTRTSSDSRENGNLKAETDVAQLPKGPQDEDDMPQDSTTLNEIIESTEQLFRYNSQVRRARFCVLICIPLIWFCSAFLVSRAFVSLHEALTVGQEGLPVLQGVVEAAHNGTSKYVNVSKQVETNRILLVEALIECPFSEESIQEVEELLAPFEFDFLQNITIPSNVTDALLLFNDTVNNITTFSHDIRDLDKSLSRTNRLLKSSIKSIDTIDEIWYYPVTVFVIAIDAIVLLFGVKIMLLLQKIPSMRLSKLLRWVFPLFVVLIFFSYLISTYSMIISEMLGDLCIGTPDDQVEDIVKAGPPFDRYVDWYTGECRAQDRPLETHGLIVGAVGGAGRAINVFIHLMNDIAGSALAGRICDGSISLVQRAIERLALSVSALVDYAADLVFLLDCELIYDIYVRLVYSTACDKAIRASAEVYAYLFPLAVLCMILISLRVAWYEDAERHYFEESSNDINDLLLVEEHGRHIDSVEDEVDTTTKIECAHAAEATSSDHPQGTGGQSRVTQERV